jgi:ferric-dicitrate binding protein FerR (iron transport regulator)
VAYVNNPISSGGRDQKDLSSKPAQANSWRDLILEKKKKTLLKAMVQAVIRRPPNSLSLVEESMAGHVGVKGVY